MSRGQIQIKHKVVSGASFTVRRWRYWVSQLFKTAQLNILPRTADAFFGSQHSQTDILVGRLSARTFSLVSRYSVCIYWITYFILGLKDVYYKRFTDSVLYFQLNHYLLSNCTIKRTVKTLYKFYILLSFCQFFSLN